MNLRSRITSASVCENISERDGVVTWQNFIRINICGNFGITSKAWYKKFSSDVCQAMRHCGFMSTLCG